MYWDNKDMKGWGSDCVFLLPFGAPMGEDVSLNYGLNCLIGFIYYLFYCIKRNVYGGYWALLGFLVTY